jgi:hypothetical protein
MIKKLGLIMVFALFTLTGCGIGPESVAQRSLEKYLDAMKSGDVDTAEGYLYADENLIDVFDYEYLSTIEKNKHQKQYTFLYDMKIANGLGNELHKKVEFVVEEYSDEYKVTEIYIRGSDDEEEEEDY